MAHIARHQVTLDEVEQVCLGNPVDLQSYMGRVVLIGPTKAGRTLAVVLDPKGKGCTTPFLPAPPVGKSAAITMSPKEARTNDT